MESPYCDFFIIAIYFAIIITTFLVVGGRETICIKGHKIAANKIYLAVFLAPIALHVITTVWFCLLLVLIIIFG